MAAARQNRHLEQIPIPCGARATIVAAETSWTAIVPTPLILLERWLLSCQTLCHNAMRRFASMTGWEEKREFDAEVSRLAWRDQTAIPSW
jgi:hypothetical protein